MDRSGAKVARERPRQEGLARARRADEEGRASGVFQAEAEATLDYVRRVHRAGRIASVCTGGMILAASGILNGAAATTKREVVPPEKSPLEVMRVSYPQIDVREAMLVDGRGVVTGGGVSLCIDTTLYLLAGMLGQPVADETARIMEYSRAWRANREGFAPVFPAK